MENKETVQFNRMQFLEKVVTDFVNKMSYNSLKTAYDGFIKLNNSGNPFQQEEKRRILEKCFDLFNDPKFREKIEEIRIDKNPRSSLLASAITKLISERILGDQKRKYDMSNRYSEQQILPNSTKYIPVDGANISVTDMLGQKVNIRKIGVLKYGSWGIDSESIDKYKVTKRLADSSIQQYEVFSFIDLYSLEENEEYRNAVLTELLSQNNIELSNTNGYVGEIVSTKHSSYQKLKVGEQRESNEKLYRYQASENYALVYNPVDLSAVMYHARHQEHNKPTNKPSVKDSDNTERS